MKRTLFAFSFALATLPAMATSGTPRITAQAPYPTVELDVLQKARLGTPHAEVAEALWRSVLAACDERDGVVAEYRDGAKRSSFDSREGAVRKQAYATCRLLEEPGNLDLAYREPPIVQKIIGDGIPPKHALVESTGRLREAYDAVTAHIHRTCADAGRRVRFASLAYGKARTEGDTRIEARYACNSAVTATNYVD